MAKVLKAQFSNGFEVVYRNGRLEPVTAQHYTTMDTMPKEVLEEGDSENTPDIPRDESKGLKQTEPKEVTYYNYPYELGDAGCDDSIVPRDKSGDGLGGEKVTFEPELADGYSSGNSDSYIQTFTPSMKPTPSGNKMNHAVANSDTEKRLAETEKKLIEAQRQLQKAEITKERERVARKIVQAEIDRKLIECNSEEDFEIRVASMLNEPTSVLLRELARVKAFPIAPKSTEASATQLTVTASKNVKNGFLDFGAGGAVTSGVATLNQPSPYVPTLGMNREELSNAIQDNLQMGQKYPRR